MTEAVAVLADWLPWVPFPADVRTAPTNPGVYAFRQAPQLVYVGRAGERDGRGMRGRLTIYVSGRAPRERPGQPRARAALQDAAWLGGRLAQVKAGEQLTVQPCSVLAVQRAALDVCWFPTEDAGQAVTLERPLAAAVPRAASAAIRSRSCALA